MATQLSQETLNHLAQFLSFLSEFKKNPLDLSFYLEHSDVSRSAEDYRKILEGFRKVVERKQKEAKDFATIILHYSTKVLPFTEASRQKAAKAVEDYAESLGSALKCMEYHLETGEFPPGMTSLKDCMSVVKGLDIITQYHNIGYEALQESRMHGKPSLTKYLREVENGDEEPKKDFWKDLRGTDWKTKLKRKIETDPNLQDLDVYEEGDAPGDGGEDTDDERVRRNKEKRRREIEQETYSRLVATSKRYNTLLHEEGDIDQWIILGAVIATDYTTRKDTKSAGRTRIPKVYIKETSDFLAIRNVPVLGIKSGNTPSAAAILKARSILQTLRKAKGRDPFFFQRTWAKYWDVCSTPKWIKGYYYFVLWPRKFRGSRSDLELKTWAFNTELSKKPVTQLEVDKT